jgi:CRP-like cAMP-binding protein
MAELNLIEKVLALEAVDLFQNLAAEQLAEIASISREAHFRPGQAILSPGHPIDSLYVVLDGDVELRRDGASFHNAKAGDVLGAWALFDDHPGGVEALARTDVKLLRVGRTDFYDLLTDNSHITQSIFSTLVRRFRQLAGN